MTTKKGKTNYVVDTEQTGRNTRLHSMHWFGAVKLTEALDITFEGRMCPREETIYDAEAMQYAGGVTWSEIQRWPKPQIAIPQFVTWILQTLEPGTEPLLWIDNNGHDKKWLDLYMDWFGDDRLLTHTSRNINDLHRGLRQGYQFATGHDVPERFRSLGSLSVTPHDHNPTNDARGKAEALLALREIGLQIEVH